MPAAAPPPAAPAPAAPAAPPKPAAVSPPTPGAPAAGTPPSGASADWMGEYDAELDSLDDNKDKPPAKPVVQPPKGVKTTETPPDDKTEPEGESAPAPTDLDAPEPVRLVDLRNAYRGLKKQIKETYKPQVTRLEARVKELEQTNGASKTLTDELERVKSRNAQLEDQISFADYSQSPKFQNEFVKPYQQAWDRAVSDFDQLQVRVPDGTNAETGEPKFKLRKATSDDLLMLANLPLSEMDERAEQMFGRSGPRVIRHVEKVRDLAIAQQNELAQQKNKTGERRAQEEAMRKTHTAKGEEMWQAEHKRLLGKYPKFFGPDPEDAEGNELLTKGKSLADRVFIRTDANRPKSAEEAVRINALAYNKIANHDRLALRLKKARARITELEKDLASYEESTPPAGTAGERTGKGAPIDYLEEANAELDRLNK